jgi:hypothetical protein
MTNNTPPTDWQTFAIHAKREQKAEAVKTKVEDHGFLYQPTSPDFIITVGGDGTLLQAERCYPSIPKLPVRDSLRCYRCDRHSIWFNGLLSLCDPHTVRRWHWPGVQ